MIVHKLKISHIPAGEVKRDTWVIWDEEPYRVVRAKRFVENRVKYVEIEYRSGFLIESSVHTLNDQIKVLAVNM